MSLPPLLSGEKALAISAAKAREMLSMTIIDSLGDISVSFKSCEINRIEIKVALPQAVHHVDYHITIFFDPSICCFKLCIYVDNNVIGSLLNVSVPDHSS